MYDMRPRPPRPSPSRLELIAGILAILTGGMVIYIGVAGLANGGGILLPLGALFIGLGVYVIFFSRRSR